MINLKSWGGLVVQLYFSFFLTFIAHYEALTLQPYLPIFGSITFGMGIIKQAFLGAEHR